MIHATRLKLLSFFLLCSALFFSAAARAEVVVSFYSHELGENFPHAFIVMKGKIDATGEVIDADYGFTPKSPSPAMLFGSVNGYVNDLAPNYIRKSAQHFELTIDDATYYRMIAKVAEWKGRAQPSYSLGKRNCVHFVMELAETVGLKVNRKSKYFKKPRSFLNEVKGLNPRLA